MLLLVPCALFIEIKRVVKPNLERMKKNAKNIIWPRTTERQAKYSLGIITLL